MDDRPIGVFDSGVGGLTVVRSLIDLLPNEHILYYGDTARGPYGPRSRDEVRRFAAEITQYLLSEGVKMIVVACNSASSAVLGYDVVRDLAGDVPVLEVVHPAVRAAIAATRNRNVGLIGTELTVASRAYETALAETRANVTLHAQACPRFVEFVERGETGNAEIVALAREYLQPLRERDVDTLILGCTHYPLLSGVIHYVMGRGVVLISSADETARDAYAELTRLSLPRAKESPPRYRFLSSGDAGLFQALGARFLGPEIVAVEERALGRTGAR